ncbi:4'-phosphopantetheinyl transferase family protein [Pseudarthrobacter chlorophenolicus]|uniref:4'-phosphopantetheinyl transferase family protein n=1 Tax=Pseudarthrobacter chlorophenolicus TaxID=85085 RepID=UPI0006979D24|nr:4'-phosphopantetheinyl transferase superfamily protein [Pseudarthrobacter chlorophenolicus]
MNNRNPPAGSVFLIVHSADLEAACAPAGGLAACLSPAEARSARRFARTADRLDYLASHALFRLVAAHRLGHGFAEAPQLEVSRRCAGCGSTGHGKPAVAGASLSLSRSKGAVMVAAGPEGTQVGADIEGIPDALHSGFDHYVASAAEREALAPGDISARIRLWVAKEAVLKAAGLGLSVPPAGVHLAGNPADDNHPALRAESPAHPQVHGLTADFVPAPPGYTAAVSAAGTTSLTRLTLADLLAA